ncbi:MAG: ABC-F family ATP-binding cassette domain-containing protein [Bacteriovoracaceae bacterium]|jgi:ABC transport system ATP-binding/permease protein|nr:ABC-F family ATP-binding cassette domain-containing protein [Bacteriovoracaceae bacterium]
MALLCTLRNIYLSFGGKSLFDGAQFNITQGERIGLLGLNGKGKSSLLKILTGELTPDTSTPPFQFDKAKGDADKRYSCFLIPQELTLGKNQEINVKDYLFEFYPELRKIHLSLTDINDKIENSEGEVQNGYIEKQKVLLDSYDHLGGWEITSAYESYLRYFGLGDLELKVRDLSGGEQKKILLSLGFTSNANLILWDEPTNHLDLETIKLFEERLNTTNKSFILVTHDRHLLGKVTNRILHINGAKISAFSGSYLDFLNFLSEEEKSRLKHLDKLKNSLRREDAWMKQGIKARRTRSKKRLDDYHQLKKKIQVVKGEARRKLELQFSESTRKTKQLVKFNSVGFSYGQNELFSNVDFTISKGDKIGLIGGNGVGKSTLVNLISGKLNPSTGEIKRSDDLMIQHFTQNREELDLTKSPFEILGDGTDSIILPNGQKKHVAAYFESFLFSRDDLHRPIQSFSGGEKNRLQMALNLLKGGDLWIFDEPTNDLDLETLQILEEKLESFEGSVILISHDRSFLGNVTNKVWLLRSQSLETFSGGYEQAEAYIDALTIEDLLDENEDDESSQLTQPEQEKAKVKLSYKEKDRLKNLPQLIKSAEKYLEQLEEKMSKFDFNKMDAEKSLEFSKLSEERDKKEEEILSCYEELEDLQDRV